jgi:D-aspartate ligase
MPDKKYLNQPPPAAIILGKTLTGLATLRSLGREAIATHIFVFDPKDPALTSRYGTKVRVFGQMADEPALIAHLIEYAKRLGGRPVVFPTSDEHALMLARHFAQLDAVCRVWVTPFENLHNIISKDGLYKAAAECGVPTIASIVSPSTDALLAWSAVNAAPYLVKPYFVGDKNHRLDSKNRVFSNREALLSFCTTHGMTSLIVQRMLRGGDGYIYDCYGLSNREGHALALASHRRLRQSDADFGATCFGEIPSGLKPAEEEHIFMLTRQLLLAMKYHGIFGVEWLLERETGNFYLIDFNARPFLTVGHLTDSGLNLPKLAYDELCSNALIAQQLAPPIAHTFWIDFLRDVQSFLEKNSRGELSFLQWLRSVLQRHCAAYFDWRDPLPGFCRSWAFVQQAIQFVYKRITGLRS